MHPPIGWEGWAVAVLGGLFALQGVIYLAVTPSPEFQAAPRRARLATWLEVPALLVAGAVLLWASVTLGQTPRWAGWSAVALGVARTGSSVWAVLVLRDPRAYVREYVEALSKHLGSQDDAEAPQWQLADRALRGVTSPLEIAVSVDSLRRALEARGQDSRVSRATVSRLPAVFWVVDREGLILESFGAALQRRFGMQDAAAVGTSLNEWPDADAFRAMVQAWEEGDAGPWLFDHPNWIASSRVGYAALGAGLFLGVGLPEPDESDQAVWKPRGVDDGAH